MSYKDDNFRAKVLLDYLSGKSAYKICSENGLSEYQLYKMVSEHNRNDANRKLKRENNKLKKQLRLSQENFTIMRDILGKL